MTPGDAAAAAHRRLGNTTQIREEIYEMNTLRLVEAFWQDLRYGMRLLIANPTFAVVAVLTLALGTGANAAIFQLVNSLRLRTLPVERPQELMSIGIETKGTGRTGRFMSRRPFFSEPLWQAVRTEQRVFSDVFAWGVGAWNLATDGEYQASQGLYVSGGFFSALGVKAHLGRLLTDADDRPGCGAPGAVLTHGFWALALRRQPHRDRSDDHARQPSVRDRRRDASRILRGRGGTRRSTSRSRSVPRPLFRGTQSGVGKGDVWFLDIMGRLHPE